MTLPSPSPTCPHLDHAIDHALGLRAVAGLSDHVEQCDECRHMLRILKEVEDVRSTEVPERVSQRAMDEITALWTEERARAKPWEIGATGVLGGMTVLTIALVAGILGAEGGFLPLGAKTAAVTLGAAWWEWRTVEEDVEPATTIRDA